jgi:hypothetical protein
MGFECYCNGALKSPLMPAAFWSDWHARGIGGVAA